MNILIDDIMKSKKQTLVNTVNCVGVMGKGIALEFKNRFPEMYREYVSLCKNHAVQPGRPYLYSDLTGASVLMFPTKDHWRSPSKLSYIVDGLDWFVENYQKLGITSVAFPPLGCGNGGLKWETVGPIMYRKLANLPIDIDLYAPFGTKREYLSADYLSSKDQVIDAEMTGEKRLSFNPRWLLALEVIRTVNAGKHTLHVGRVLFQKICYVLTRSGIRTGFTFTQAWFGPYSDQVKDAITVLSNANLITEKQVQVKGMIEIHVSPSFKLPDKTYSGTELKIVDSCIDLFSRVKNTQHAEIITTVMYTYDELAQKQDVVSDEDIFNAVMIWKKRWKDDKDDEVRNTIRGLAAMGWIDPVPVSEEKEIV